jgi:hypothetical protein
MARTNRIHVAEGAKIGYPVVRLVSPPDMPFDSRLAGASRGEA